MPIADIVMQVFFKELEKVLAQASACAQWQRTCRHAAGGCHWLMAKKPAGGPGTLTDSIFTDSIL